MDVKKPIYKKWLGTGWNDTCVNGGTWWFHHTGDQHWSRSEKSSKLLPHPSCIGTSLLSFLDQELRLQKRRAGKCWRCKHQTKNKVECVWFFSNHLEKIRVPYLFWIKCPTNLPTSVMFMPNIQENTTHEPCELRPQNDIPPWTTGVFIDQSSILAYPLVASVLSWWIFLIEIQHPKNITFLLGSCK